MNNFINLLRRFYILIITLFLYIPIAVLIGLSFNASDARSVWGGFTWDWYFTLLDSNVILEALKNTLTIGFLSATVATLIGLAAAIGITGMRRRNYAIVLGLGNIPMLNADIVTGIILMLTITRFIELGYFSILLAHITFSIPYVVMCILPRLKSMDMSIYEAARDLGADAFTAFRKVMLPHLMPAVLGGFFIALTMSMDDFVVTYFTKGAGIDTLSTMIYGELKRGIKPEMYALSSVIFFLALFILIIVNYLPDWKKKVRP